MIGMGAIAAIAIEDPNTDGVIHIGRQALRDALSNTQNYQGITGLLTCDQFGDCAAPSSGMVLLEDSAADFNTVRSNFVYILSE